MGAGSPSEQSSGAGPSRPHGRTPLTRPLGRKGHAMSRFLYRIGHFAGRHPWRVLAAWVLVAVTAFVLNGAPAGPPDESFPLPGSDSQRAPDAITDRFPQATLYSSNVLLHAEEGLTTPAA